MLQLLQRKYNTKTIKKKQSLISLHDIMSVFKYIYVQTYKKRMWFTQRVLRDVPWNLNHTVEKVRSIEMQDETSQSVRLMLK